MPKPLANTIRSFENLILEDEFDGMPVKGELT
jgi:hypothetical protein